MDLRTFEKQISDMTLTFPRERTAEWTRFPSMVGIYRQLASNCIPCQTAFANKVATEMNRLDDAGVIARACRTYPSLIRQHHFLLVLQEAFDLAIWDEAVDQYGVDIVVIENACAYGVALSTETAKARYWHDIKQRRQTHRPPIPTIELWAEPDHYSVGPFWLHSPEQVEEVRAFIERTIVQRAS